MEDVQQSARRRPGRPSARPAVRQAFVELLRVRSFHDVTVDEIVGRAGLSRMAFYAHFQGKSELLKEIAAETAAEFAEAGKGWLAGSMADDLTPEEEVHRALEELLATFAENGPIVRAVVDASTVDDDVARMWDGVIDGFVEAVATRHRSDGASGHARDVDSIATARALCLMVERTLYRAAVRGVGPTAAEATALGDIWLHALYPDTDRA